MNRIVIFILIFIWSIKGHSDYAVDFAQVSCAKDVGFFSINYESFTNWQIFTKGEITKGKKDVTLSKWKTNGFYPTEESTFECTLSNKKIKARIYSEEYHQGRCGAAPRTHIAIEIDDEKVFERLFGYDCLGEKSVRKIEIWDNSRTANLYPYSKLSRPEEVLVPH